jgi:DNA-binding response OmpR family regulator
MHCDEHPGAILLVDDDDCIRKLVKQCLERAGYTVIVASDGDRVLELDGALPVLSCPAVLMPIAEMAA